MREMLGIITLYDGSYYKTTCRLDAWTIVVDKPVDPVHATNIESKLVYEYKINRRMNSRARAIELLCELGYNEVKSVICRMDYTGTDRSD